MVSKKYQSARYSDYEFDDETSAFDPKGVWQGGGEYYKATYRCRVPRRLLEKAEAAQNYRQLEDWISNHGEDEIWRD